MPRRSPGLEANFAALGVGFTFRPMSALGGAYGGFTLSAPPVREIAPATLRVGASDGAGAVARMTDRIGATLWSTGRPQRGGEWIHVDLGAAVPWRSFAGCPARSRRSRGACGSRPRATGSRGAPSSTCPSTWGRSTGPRAGRWRACGAAGWSSACRRSRFATCASRRPGETRSGRGRSASSTCTWRRAGLRYRRSRRMGRRSREPSAPRECGGSMPTTAGRAGSPSPIPRSASRPPTSRWTTTAGRARRRCCSRPFAGSPGPESCWSRVTPRASPLWPSPAASPSRDTRSAGSRCSSMRTRPRRGRRFPPPCSP